MTNNTKVQEALQCMLKQLKKKEKVTRSKRKRSYVTVRATQEWIVAVDCSLCSPGVAILHQPSGTRHVIGWAQNEKQYERWKQVQAPFQLNAPFLSSTNMDVRLEEVSQAIVFTIDHVTKGSHDVLVAFEALPFALNHTSSRTQLSDVLALTRHKCFLRGFSLTSLMPPTIKKKWTGNGHATKPDMWITFRDKVVCHQSAEAAAFCHALSRHDGTTIDHPLEDMIDAWAIVDVLIQ